MPTASSNGIEEDTGDGDSIGACALWPKCEGSVLDVGYVKQLGEK